MTYKVYHTVNGDVNTTLYLHQNIVGKQSTMK